MRCCFGTLWWQWLFLDTGTSKATFSSSTEDLFYLEPGSWHALRKSSDWLVNGTMATRPDSGISSLVACSFMLVLQFNQAVRLTLGHKLCLNSAIKLKFIQEGQNFELSSSI